MATGDNLSKLAPGEIDHWLDTFRQLGEKIAAVVEEYAGTKDGALIMGKGAGGDFTLKIDKLAENVVFDKLETLHNNFGQEFTLVSEELGIHTFGSQPDLHILIDPVDGSFNARQGIPYYSTAMALATGSRVEDVVLGYVRNLANKDEFYALKGQGAFCNRQPIRTKDVDIPRAFVFEAAHNKAGLKRVAVLIEMFERARSLGSTALDICYLAAGRIDVFFYPVPSRTIDYVAGKIILEEAGGIITGMSGENLGELPLNLERTHPLVAAGNRKIMKKVMDIIQISRI